MAVVDSSERRAFLAAASRWNAGADQDALCRMLRSPYSGVPIEVGAAYAALARRASSSLTDVLDAQRLVDASSRDAVIAFSALARSIAQAEPAALPSLLADRALPRASPRADDGAPIALAAASDPQIAPGVATANPRFSASQLNMYAECERKWFYRYVCNAVEDAGSSASYYGTAFHAALEALHAAYPRPGEIAEDELHRRLEGEINTAFAHFSGVFETPVELELQRRRARRTARKYIAWLVAEARRAPFTVVGCELAAQMPVDGFDFIGYIDRLDRDDATGAVRVIDYKTGAIATSADEYREKVRRFKDFQLPFYYWARTEAGDRVSTLALIPLKDALLDVAPVSLEVVALAPNAAPSKRANGVIPLAELERARERMGEICRTLASPVTTRFSVSTDPAACTYCAYTLACATRPHAPEESFGR